VLDRPAGPETDVADVRDRSTADPTEAVDAPARIPTVDETTAAVTRAQLALAEIRARDSADERRDTDTTWVAAQDDSREETTGWNDDLVAER
jgi:hypothetical protein